MAFKVESCGIPCDVENRTIMLGFIGSFLASLTILILTAKRPGGVSHPYDKVAMGLERRE
jgi:hypothetical protein